MARKQDDELGDEQKRQLTEAILKVFRSCGEAVAIEDCGGGYWQMNVTIRKESLVEAVIEQLEFAKNYAGRNVPVEPAGRDPMEMARSFVFALNKARHDEKAKNSTGEQRE